MFTKSRYITWVFRWVSWISWRRLTNVGFEPSSKGTTRCHVGPREPKVISLAAAPTPNVVYRARSGFAYIDTIESNLDDIGLVRCLATLRLARMASRRSNRGSDHLHMRANETGHPDTLYDVHTVLIPNIGSRQNSLGTQSQLHQGSHRLFTSQ